VTAVELVRYLTWTIYAVIFVHVVGQAIRSPRGTNINITIFFALPALIIALNVAQLLDLAELGPLLGRINGVLILLFAFFLLRLVNDFAPTPRQIMLGALVALFLISVAWWLLQPAPSWLALLLVLYVFGIKAYGASRFLQQARRSSGVTQRRMRMVAAGAILVGVAVFFSAMRTLVPTQADLFSALTQAMALSSALSYYAGFSPPATLRRLWQEPELRAFLGRSARLPRLPTTEAIVQELARGAAASTGAPRATIGLWDEEHELLRFPSAGPFSEYKPDEQLPAGRAFLLQQPQFSGNVEQEGPQYATTFRTAGARTVLAAPITAGDRRLGVLVVYGPTTSLFAEDDLILVQLLADQAAVILESRALIDEAARVQAREEATRMKDDFLSAAAHDLKTPLTTLVIQSQLLERRLLRDPETRVDLASIQRIVQEAIRLKALVLELLDATRAERGQIVGQLERTDLAIITEESSQRHAWLQHKLALQIERPLEGNFDSIRIAQLMDNLIENAIKYSPTGGTVEISLRREEEHAYLTISDQGIGIPRADLPHIFDRFYRAGNVNDRAFAGMGLGLFICRAIVEQHGGRIWATSQPGEGTTFHITLPLPTGSAPAA
jgi:signal transduction histidine kinase